jgi:hypothetical protein
MPTSPLFFKRWEFRTVLIICSSVALLFIVAGYILFQARFLVAGPQITLLGEPGVQHNTRTITLSGTAENITHLWLNDRQIFTDEGGYFSEALVLENGYTIATLKARDRFGRETRVERPFVYTPASIIQG